MPAHTVTFDATSFDWDTIRQVLALDLDAKRKIAVEAWRCPFVRLKEIMGQRQIASLALGLIQGHSPESFTTALMDEVIAVGLENQIVVIADFYHQPAERRTLDYPGCDEEMTLESVSLATVDITYCLSDSDRASLEESALDRLTEQRAADAAEERWAWRTGT